MKDWVSPIPRKIHLIWIGKLDPPDYFTKYFLPSFHKHLPEFEIKVWGNKDITKKKFPKTFDYIKEAKKRQGKPIKDENGYIMYSDPQLKKPLTYSKWAQITDLMRLEIVYNHGGFYFDTTFEILKPLYNLFNKKHYKFIGCNEVPRFKDFGSLSNSFFGAVKGSIILKRLLSKQWLDDIDFDSTQVDSETGPAFLRSAIYEKDNYKILPTYYFYPFIEPYDPPHIIDPPYRKVSKNKCHRDKRRKTNRKTKQKYKRLQSKKGYILYPCKNYPKSYALKHWQLGKSWMSSSNGYYTNNPENDDNDDDY